MRGGKTSCPTDTLKEQTIVNFWKTTSRILNESYDANYRTEWHIIGTFQSCNMWVWKKDETSKFLDKHIDCYWQSYTDNSKILGVKATITRSKSNPYNTERFIQISKVTAAQRSVNLTQEYNDFDQEIFCAHIAAIINAVYDEAFSRH